MNTANLSILAELYGRVYEHTLTLSAQQCGSVTDNRKHAPVGIAIAREEAEKALETVVRAATPSAGAAQGGEG